jgi:ribosomal-protein-alanine N-acetyltransferase
MEVNFIPFPILETESLLLRSLSDKDANEIFILRSNPEVNRFVERTKPETLDDALTHIHKLKTGMENGELIYWGLIHKHSDKLIGTICLWNINREKEVAEVGYELLPQFQQQGYMSEALKEVIRYGLEVMKLKRIEGWVNSKNLRSINLLKKFRFIKDDMPGKNILTDEVIYFISN